MVFTSAPFDLTGKVAVVTGGSGSSGVGLDMAAGMAQAGAKVSIWGTNTDKNAAALADLERRGTRVSALTCDVTDDNQVTRCFEVTLACHGRVDGCFANAGVGGPGARFDDMSNDEWRQVPAVNQNGAFYTFKHAARHMRQRAGAGDPGGRPVGTASLAAVSGQPRGEHYAAAKSGLISMIKALALSRGAQEKRDANESGGVRRDAGRERSLTDGGVVGATSRPPNTIDSILPSSRVRSPSNADSSTPQPQKLRVGIGPLL